jgi:hypothetical protein
MLLSGRGLRGRRGALHGAEIPNSRDIVLLKARCERSRNLLACHSGHPKARASSREKPDTIAVCVLRLARPSTRAYIYGVLALSSAFIIVKGDRKTNAAFVYEAHEHTKMRRKSFDGGIVARPLCTFCTFVDRIIKRLLRGVQFSLEPPQHH